jgi:hypothetical protein
LTGQMFAKVVLASRPTTGAAPILTIHARYPRIIHGELMTHRVFSRNARSSRAVPVKTMLNEVRSAPFVPWHWGKNQAGMKASEDCNERVDVTVHSEEDGWCRADVTREEAWLSGRDDAANLAEAYMNAGYHKQIPNRLLEPFSYIDTLITSTSWANFLHLRDHEDAEPHFQDLAPLFHEAVATANYQNLRPGEWHLPFITEEEYDEWLFGETPRSLDIYNRFGLNGTEVLKRLSVARCARISYAPFDGNPAVDREFERYQDLISGSRLHASPFEHQASPDHRRDCSALGGNLGAGWIQLRKTMPGEYMPTRF